MTLSEAYAKLTRYNDKNAEQSDIDAITASLDAAFNSLKKLIKPQAVYIQYYNGEYISK